MIGVMLILALTGNSLNIFTMLGMIMLIGLVAKNAILIVDFTNARKSSRRIYSRCFNTSKSCSSSSYFDDNNCHDFRMLPIALANGAGAEMNKGLAWVIIGGLTSSLFLTLIIVPIVYSLFDSVLENGQT